MQFLLLAYPEVFEIGADFRLWPQGADNDVRFHVGS
jgi:hypothetical protein